ncbi:MAG: alpha/beta hydrolase [Myxococcota bacterium]
MTRRLVATAAGLVLLASGCLTLDSFFFSNEPVEDYRWDDDPCDPQLQGEITEAENRLEGGPAPSCHPSRIGPDERHEGFVSLEDGRKIHYVYAHNPAATTTIFYSHGTSRHLGRYWDRVELLWSWGYNVMIYDYPGYGRSEGEPDQAGVYASARAVLERVLPDMPGVDLDRVFFMGYSLGGGPTYQLAFEASAGTLSVTPRGVVTEAVFCSTEALIQDGTRLDLPVEFLSDNPFDNCDRIGRLDRDLPVLLVHGAADDFIVPLHAHMLHDAAVGEDVTLLLVPESDHSEVPVAGRELYEQSLRDFFDRLAPTE